MPTLLEIYPDIYDPTYGADQPSNVNLYAAVLYLLRTRFAYDPEAKSLSIAADLDPPGLTLNIEPKDFPGSLSPPQKVQFLAVYGRLATTNMADPANGRSSADPYSADELKLRHPTETGALIRVVPAFVRAFIDAIERYHAHKELYEKVFNVLRSVGESPEDVDAETAPDDQTTIFASQLSEVVDRLVEDRVTATSPQLGVKIRQAIGQAVGGATQGRASAIRIDLPDLDEDLSVDIIGDNVRALAVLYFAAQLEDMRFFAVADKVAEQFQVGMVPLSRGSGGDRVFEFIKGAQNRFTEVERRGMYARAFGFAQGGVDESLPNREFNNLWIRALSATSAHARQFTSQTASTSGSDVINLNVTNSTNRVHHMQVYKSLRDLGVNLSLHGYAMAHFAAVELQGTIKSIKMMLMHPDVLAAYGVRDYFQLIERVAQLYLGSNVNSIRQRVQAQSGSQIIQWIANSSPVLASPVPPDAAVFLDRGLVDNVEKWLAVTGTGDATVEQFSEPSMVQSQPTIPSLGLSSAGNALQAAMDAIGDLPQA